MDLDLSSAKKTIDMAHNLFRQLLGDMDGGDSDEEQALMEYQEGDSDSSSSEDEVNQEGGLICCTIGQMFLYPESTEHR